MCYAVKIAIDQAHMETLKQYCPTTFRLLPEEDISVRKVFGTRSVFSIRSPGVCECQFSHALVRAVQDADLESRREERYVTHFRATRMKRGWSLQKIETALEKSLAAYRRPKPPDTTGSRWVAEFVQWMRDVVTRSGEIMLVVHWFSDTIKREHPPLTISIDDLGSSAQPIPYERLVRIVPAHRHAFPQSGR